MKIPLTGPIQLESPVCGIANTHGGNRPHGIKEFYRGGAYVENWTPNNKIVAVPAGAVGSNQKFSNYRGSFPLNGFKKDIPYVRGRRDGMMIPFDNPANSGQCVNGNTNTMFNSNNVYPFTGRSYSTLNYNTQNLGRGRIPCLVDARITGAQYNAEPNGEKKYIAAAGGVAYQQFAPKRTTQPTTPTGVAYMHNTQSIAGHVHVYLNSNRYVYVAMVLRYVSRNFIDRQNYPYFEVGLSAMWALTFFHKRPGFYSSNSLFPRQVASPVNPRPSPAVTTIIGELDNRSGVNRASFWLNGSKVINSVASNATSTSRTLSRKNGAKHELSCKAYIQNRGDNLGYGLIHSRATPLTASQIRDLHNDLLAVSGY